MTNIVDFADLRREPRVVPPHANTIVAVHDELLPAIGPDSWMVEFPGFWVRYLAQSRAERDELEVDDWICPQSPSAPDRTVLFATLDGSLLEVDGERWLYRNGERMYPAPLLSFGTPALAATEQLTLGHEAALLIGCEIGSGSFVSMWRFGIGLTPPITWIYATPEHQQLPGDIATRWLAKAQAKLDGRR